MSNLITNEVQNRHLTTETRRQEGHNSDTEHQRQLRTGEGKSHADVDRATQRLAQQTTQTPATTIADLETARERVNELKSLLNANPQAGIAANGGVTRDGFEAAMARPTA